MMIRRNQILTVKQKILPVIHFAVCFSDVSKNQNICAINICLTDNVNCIMKELHLPVGLWGSESQY